MSHARQLLAVATLAFAVPSSAAPDPVVTDRFLRLTREAAWTPVAAIRIPFRTFHPQGMVRVGKYFYVSSVEVRTRPIRYPAPRDGYDRDTGAGVGHLFKIGPDGALLADLILGEGAIYHPGGIDYDGKSIWVPVSEYRPGSRAIVYKVDPVTMRASAVLRFADHIGGIVHDTDDDTLHAVTWGSRSFFSWPRGGTGPVAGPVANPGQYIDYQDCHYAGAHRMLCAGLGEYRTGPNTPVFPLGGIDLIDLADHRAVWQVPVELRAPSGRSMTQNPFFLEATGTGLRAYFMPDDDASTLFVYDVAPVTR